MAPTRDGDSGLIVTPEAVPRVLAETVALASQTAEAQNDLAKQFKGLPERVAALEQRWKFAGWLFGAVGGGGGVAAIIFFIARAAG